MNRAQVVDQLLPHRIERSGSRWQMRDPSIEPLVDRVLRIIAGADERDEVTWYKRAERKQVFRVEEGYVAKVFLLPALSLRLKYRRYARDEAAYMTVAAEKGIRVPPVYAIGTFRTPLGLVWQTAMIVGELRRMRTVIDMLRDAAGRPDEIDGVLRAAVPLFEQLYRSGCKHIDVNAGNVLLDLEDASRPPALIDFKYAGFHVRPSLEVTMFQASQFIGFCGELVSPEAAGRWLNALLDRIEVRDAADRAWCRGRFEHYCCNTYSRKQRQRLNPHPKR